MKRINQTNEEIQELNRFNNSFYQQPQLFWNDKVFVITKPKIAHSLCRDIFVGREDGWKLPGTGFIMNPVTFEMNPKHITEIPEENKKWQEKYNKEGIEIWNNFLNKKEKRDLIILYRNPYEHFLSGFTQDTLIFNNLPCGKMLQPLLTIWVNTIDIDESQGYKNKFVNRFIENREGYGGFVGLLKEFPTITTKLIEMLFRNHINNGFYTAGHYSSWLSTIYPLYDGGIVDKNKVKFIDIYEDSLFKVLDPYVEKWPEYLEEQRESKRYKNRNTIYEILDNLIANDDSWQKIIKHSIEADMIVFNKIKNLVNDK